MHVINQWNGEVSIMGDFNEVRYKSDRFGSIFNSQGADEFNSFIVNVGLEEVPLGGSTFTWCHKSATKMSKLDRFLVSDNLFTICPHISAITLERYLSDHSPILLREAANDYAPVDVSNEMRNMVGKMRYLKLKIREWIKSNRPNQKELIDRYKDELRMLDVVIDKGDGTDAMVTKRMDVINSMQHLDHLYALDMAQKTKIKWVVEGDENTHELSEISFNRATGGKQSLVFKVDFEKAYDSECLRSSSDSILVNGSPTEEFQFFKGLKQGDPLSPFVFILIMESLHLSFQRVVDAGMFKGIKLSQSLSLSHIINMSKSKIMGVNVEDEKVKHAASKLGCLTLKSPFLYLGTKVGATMSRVSDWKEVVEKSVLGSIPIFHMSIFRVPSSVLNMLESIRSHFFNGHELGSNKATWVKWSRVLTAIDHGGLGVSSLYALNRGLMVKWFWRFYSQKTSLWANVIKAIHGEDGNVDKAHYIGGRTCWTSIVHEVKDNWCSEGILKDLFPRLYALESCKLVNVCTKLNDPSLVSSFRRHVRGGAEQIQLDNLSDMIRSVNLVPMADRWVWNLESSGDFSVSSIRKVIDEKRFPSVCSKTRWVKYVSIKVNVLAWKIKIDGLPTRFNISRRGIDIHSILCPVCDGGVESSEHLFFRCHLSKQIARKVSLWWNVAYVDVNSYAEWYSWIVSLRIAAKSKLMLEGVFYTMWWQLWTYRNKLLFDDKVPSKTVIGIVAIQPFFGSEKRTDSEKELEQSLALPLKRADWYWSAFMPLGEGYNRDHPIINVSGPKALDISKVNFPPTLVVVSGFDILRDSHKMYYEWLRKSEKEVYLVEYPSMFHGFYNFPELPESGQLISDVKEFIYRVLKNVWNQ
ncbi:RNA-directed DNA polymerase, eukaryota, reverse transcriptase zinc-binding domain protein [Tanacetum coccineum]